MNERARIAEPVVPLSPATGPAAKPDAPSAPSPLAKERLRVWLRMLKSTRAVEAELRERMRAKWNTTLPRFDVMAALDRHRDGLRMSELSGVLRVSNGNVTGLVDRLVEDGLVERRVVREDRRASRVRLTAAGRDLFADMARVHEGWVDELLSPIGAEGLEVLRTRLDRLDASRTDRAARTPAPSASKQEDRP